MLRWKLPCPILIPRPYVGVVVQEREILLRVVLLEEGNLLRVVQSELEKDVLLLMVRVEGFLLAFRAGVYRY